MTNNDSEKGLPIMKARMEQDFLGSKIRRMVVDLARGFIDKHGVIVVRSQLGNITETIYQKLPSGDYGRGDVKRVIEEML
jgi:hypothetical protein